MVVPLTLKTEERQWRDSNRNLLASALEMLSCSSLSDTSLSEVEVVEGGWKAAGCCGQECLGLELEPSDALESLSPFLLSPAGTERKGHITL